MNQFGFKSSMHVGLKAPYVRVTEERRIYLIQLLINNPGMQVKQAAKIAQIKYQRATAISREYKDYI